MGLGRCRLASAPHPPVALLPQLPGSLKVWPGSLKVWPGSLKVWPGSLKVWPGSLKVWPHSLKVRPSRSYGSSSSYSTRAAAPRARQTLCWRHRSCWA